MVVFAGYSITSNVKYFSTDTVSLDYGHNKAPADFCGEKFLKFTINGTETSVLTA